MRYTIVTLILLSVCGCQSNGKNARNGSALTGRVIALEPRGLPYAAVGDVPLDSIHIGDTVSFLDEYKDVASTGVVRRVTDGAVHVEWMKSNANRRAPRIGDVVKIHANPSAPSSSEALYEATTQPASEPATEPATEPASEPAGK